MGIFKFWGSMWRVKTVTKFKNSFFPVLIYWNNNRIHLNILESRFGPPPTWEKQERKKIISTFAASFPGGVAHPPRRQPAHVDHLGDQQGQGLHHLHHPPQSGHDFFQGLSLPGNGSLEALTAHVEMASPADLTDFLSGFQVWLISTSWTLFQKSIRINRTLVSVHSTSSDRWHGRDREGELLSYIEKLAVLEKLAV